MRVGMMQPYFFPYLGYFGLIESTDCWVVFDTAQYIRRGWVNRNRVASTGKNGWKYIRVPVAKCAATTPINEIRVANQAGWQKQLLLNLDAYRCRRAPYFNDTIDFLAATLAYESCLLSELLIHCLTSVCEHINLPIDCRVFAQLDQNDIVASAPGDWALETSRMLNASTYVNPPGGRHIFDAQRFTSSGIQLRILNPSLPAYSQGPQDFQPGLSIIDALMWNDPSAVRQMAGDYRLEAA